MPGLAGAVPAGALDPHRTDGSERQPFQQPHAASTEVVHTHGNDGASMLVIVGGRRRGFRAVRRE